LHEGLVQEPDSPYLLYLAAFIEHSDDNHEDALAAVARVLEVDPTNFPARKLLASVQIDLGRHGEAEKTLLGLLGEAPQDVDLLCDYSRLMLLTLHIDKAAALSEEALRIAPEDDRALSTRALVGLVRRPTGKSLDEVSQLVAHQPDARHTAYLLLQALIDDGRDKEALVLAQQLLREDPSNQALVDVIVGMQLRTHWSMIPLRPFTRWGWGGSAAMWFLVIAGLRGLRGAGLVTLAGILGVAWLVFCIYSWVWPSMLERILKR